MNPPTVVSAGPTNSLLDVPGIRVGQAQRRGDGWLTGVTVVLPPPEGAVAGVDVRGGGPGTRETDLLDPRKLVERVHAVVLTGGSAFGLASMDGVVTRLADEGIGFPVGDGVVPIVPGAVIFDLGRGGTFRATPDPALGASAYDAAGSTRIEQGSVGAGTGAVAGGMAGGVGTASAVLSDGCTVAALAVVNAAGSAVDPRTGVLHGSTDGLPGEFDLVIPRPDEVERWAGPTEPGRFNFNTTLAVVATDAPLTKAGCGGLASAAHDGLARALRPAHTITDGDTVFALSTGVGEPLAGIAQRWVQATAADCLSRAIAHGVLAAADRPDARSYRALFPSAVGRREP